MDLAEWWSSLSEVAIAARDARVFSNFHPERRALVLPRRTGGALALPNAYMKRTGFGGHLEHFVAYLLTAGIFCLAYRSRPQSVIIAIGLAAAAALIEVGQSFSPVRPR
jgi:VanZ family protein